MNLLKYEKPLLYDLHAAVTAEGWTCGSGSRNNRGCASGTGAGSSGAVCAAGSSGNGCNSGSYASHCNSGSGANAATCYYGPAANADCISGTAAGFSCSTGTST
jgi:hypothetical protein